MATKVAVQISNRETKVRGRTRDVRDALCIREGQGPEEIDGTKKMQGASVELKGLQL